PEDGKKELKAPVASDLDDKKAQGKAAETEKAPAAPQEGKFHVVKSGDTLGGIAKQYYGRASMEDMIFKANAKVIKNRNRLSVGMRLVIPEL
ncbi:MAG: LysM peptidoglycan-binding domain-containing protein, partial [Lentisphaeria bacterium]|nr:LysM peptidoglycan-binding domain-containing protein [Lentisphaeria bacterium]